MKKGPLNILACVDRWLISRESDISIVGSESTSSRNIVSSELVDHIFDDISNSNSNSDNGNNKSNNNMKNSNSSSSNSKKTGNNNKNDQLLSINNSTGGGNNDNIDNDNGNIDLLRCFALVYERKGEHASLDLYIFILFHFIFYILFSVSHFCVYSFCWLF